MSKKRQTVEDGKLFPLLISSEASRPRAGASRERNTVLIVPLDPACKAGLAGHLQVKAVS